jgi:DNA-binding NtrC family response regulator
VEVGSQPGQGSTFEFFNPLHAAAPETGGTPPVPPPVRHGQETILVVEDEDLLRNLVTRVLACRGYQVLAAASGKQALELWEAGRGKIDLLLTDMVMPGGMSGSQLAARLLAQAPGLRVIYTSGYSHSTAGKDAVRLEGHDFLVKPYEPNLLLKLVRECLDGAGGRRGPSAPDAGAPKRLDREFPPRGGLRG